jgi:hypothetical protein
LTTCLKRQVRADILTANGGVDVDMAVGVVLVIAQGMGWML